MKQPKIIFPLLLLWLASSIAGAQCPMNDPVMVINTANTGNGSLRWAIDCVNSVPALHTIEFAISGPLLKIIQPTSALPNVSKAGALIDGTTQSVILDGSSTAGANGLTLVGNNITVQSLYVRSFSGAAGGHGIVISNGNGSVIQNNRLANNRVGIGSGSSAFSFTITGNIIGLNNAGNAFPNTEAGISILGNPTNSEISNNEIAYNTGQGINTLAGNVLISNNSIYCNTGDGIQRTAAPAIPVITSASTQLVRGLAAAGRVIEVFVYSTVGCAATPVQGKTYLGTVTTPGSGIWTLMPAAGALVAGDRVTATSTQNTNNTSEFSAPVTVADCAAFVASISQTDVACFGANDGSATAMPDAAGFAYAWNTGPATATISGLAPGIYIVTVTQVATGCTSVRTANITEPPALTLSVSSTNVSCFNGNNGTATATGNGGTPGYTFMWNNGQTMPMETGLMAGNYTVTVTDMNGCTMVEGTTVLQPAALDLAVSATNVSCFNGNNGTATATGNGGTPGYTFMWNNGQTMPMAIDLVAGNYTVTVTDMNGCTMVEGITVLQPAALGLNINATGETAVNANNGHATAVPNGGVAPFTYQWNNGAATAQITGLAPGMYDLTVMDQNGCIVTGSTVINSFSCAGLQATISHTDVSCFGGNNGSATVAPAGGLPPYVFAWSSGQITATATGLMTGNYTVTMTDQNSCTHVQGTTIAQPTALSLTVNATDETAVNTNNGTAAALPNGGTPPFVYDWNNMGTTAQITGLVPGIYTVTVTDQNGCTITGSVTVNSFSCAGFQALVSTMNISCFGGNNGTATATPMGGTPGYLFAWSNGQTTATATNLVAGTHTVTITDQGGCLTGQNALLTQPPLLTVTINATNETVASTNDGQATAAPDGGTAIFAYLWNTGATTAQITNLPPGPYTVTITDAQGCTTIGSTTIAAGIGSGGCMVPPVYALAAPVQVCGNTTFKLRVTDPLANPLVRYVWILPNGDTIVTDSLQLNVVATSGEFSGEYFVLRDSAGCRSIAVGGAEITILTVDDLFAGNDTILCSAGLAVLRADPLTSGTGTWASLGTATVDDPGKNPTVGRNLQPGRNTFVWQAALANCPQAGTDTVTYFLENKPNARDDNYTLERAFDVVVMEVLLNDALGGLTDTLLVNISEPSRGQLELLAETRRFRYTVEEDFRGIVTFQYTVCSPGAVCTLPCDTATVTIEIRNLPTVPSGLVTEDNGPNGELTIRGADGFTRVEITITDRWGDLVFQEKNYTNGQPWLGDYQRTGKYLPGGAYYYYLKAYDGQAQVGNTMTGVIHLFNK